MNEIEFTLNNQTKSVCARDDESLLETLRERCDIISTKDGCQPQGQCGCCLAIIDGQAKVTCAMPASKIAGKDVLTLEGLSEEERDLTARAFVAAAGLQCGYCIPGIALRAKHILDNNPKPSRDDISKALDVHLCRCTGYIKIVDAIELMGEVRRGERELPELCTDGKVGASLARYRGLALAMGDRPYVADMRVPNMLHGAILQSPHPRAKVVKIDTSKAEAYPGVTAVATAKDVPGERYYGLIYKD
ncbi:MAG: 2Fe-2S iron-sulfur cluster-binding protein, partial [Planctomycetota bacterium]|nr:2Fe-2S iron-sulfur cluster-binding protein [Planctomycetota bacterium]